MYFTATFIIKLKDDCIRKLQEKGYTNPDETSELITYLIDAYDFDDEITPEQEEYYAEIEKQMEEGTLDISETYTAEEFRKEFLGE